ncbi:fungal-specific transcription factor domain-containing protein [Boeremia exigua]|uniref:fungal-specific transcription factor domain-containing protein n=1 Tax=Boeremia exigua TaxID=749465 RepID=UPI001E8CE980|nr:fungal-specific transcription factor domain-containing protein [Boeremia exigua]KAH6639155.1 fungal-specific transcription factor domain-containing protein [Boeremia exigua]
MKDELERLRARCSALEEGLTTIAPRHAPNLLRQLSRGEAPTWADVAPSLPGTPSACDSDDGEGRLLHDPDGASRFLGESSGATFLDQLKQFIRTLLRSLAYVPGADDGFGFVASVGSYQTYDSRPLANPNVDPHWLPSQPEISTMLHELRQYIQDGNGAFKSGGIFWWGDLEQLPVPLASPMSITAMTMNDAHRYLAFYHACFALSVSLRHSSLRLSDYQSGEAYFKRARMLLGNPVETVHFALEDVPALSLMGYYLIEVNRRDAAYMYVSLAVHTAIIHGSFRHAVDERSKRMFWTLYIMDRWISMLMGRPPIIPDDAIRLPLPAPDPSMPPCVGLCANIRLAKISGYIVRETYGIAPRYPRAVGSEENIKRALKMLHDWYSQLPEELEFRPDQRPLDSACCTLHMYYNQLIILTTRPIFFAAIKKVVAQRMLGGASPSEVHVHETYTRLCIEAAQRNLELARHLQSTNQNWLQSGLHFLFNAAVILLLNRIHLAHGENIVPNRAIEGQNAAVVGFAIHVFQQEAATGTSYPQDCCRVLQDLNSLTELYAVTVVQHKPNLQQGRVGRKIHTPVLQPAIFSQQRPLHGSNDDCTVYERMMTWAQTDSSNLLDAFNI